MSNNPEAIETKVTIENPDVGEEADDVMEMKAISGSGMAQPPTIKVKLMTCFHEFSKYVSTIFFSTKSSCSAYQTTNFMNPEFQFP